MTPAASRLAAALFVTAVAYGLYRSTMLPGQDLGDTAVFQVIAATGAPPTARDAYPLYYALAKRAARTDAANPARALNHMSAVTGASAAGAMAWVAAEITAAPILAVLSGLLFASSYTFWTQSIIAEVYALNVLFVMVSMAALLAWAKRPTLARLGLFFAVYAVSFGNHLSMVLLLPAFSVFVIAEARHHPGGVRSVVRPRVIVLAAACVVTGALQYASMLNVLWDFPRPLANIRELLPAFWFDVTKADWRQTLVMGVRLDQFPDRLAMYWFDLREQFGWPAVAIAAFGGLVLRRRQPRVAMMLALAYAAAFLFAFTYNVGDTHVFYLTSHAVVALVFACGLSNWYGTLVSPAFRRKILPATLAVAYVIWRIADTYPAVDRSADRRVERFFRELTQGLSARRDLFIADLTWQQIDGLAYYSSVTNQDVLWCPAVDVLSHFPALVRDNHEIGRHVVLNGRARDLVVATYGDRFVTERDPRTKTAPLDRSLENVAKGTPYAMTWITPYPDTPVDPREVTDALRLLTTRMAAMDASARYGVVAGRVGEPAQLVRTGSRPFRATADLSGLRLLVRFDSWRAFDTIRRAGFGHVIVGGHDVLPIDRGLSLVLLGDGGLKNRIFYRGGVLEPQERFLVRPPAGAPEAAVLLWR